MIMLVDLRISGPKVTDVEKGQKQNCETFHIGHILSSKVVGTSIITTRPTQDRI